MNKTLLASLILSCLSVILTTWINLSMASRYLHADGKTRALFGIVELSYGFQYGVAIFVGITALILGFVPKGRSRLQMVCVGLALISIIIVFVPVWRLFTLI
jgi:hypothetical protein